MLSCTVVFAGFIVLVCVLLYWICVRHMYRLFGFCIGFIMSCVYRGLLSYSCLLMLCRFVWVPIDGVYFVTCCSSLWSGFGCLRDLIGLLWFVCLGLRLFCRLFYVYCNFGLLTCFGVHNRFLFPLLGLILFVPCTYWYELQLCVWVLELC